MEYSHLGQNRIKQNIQAMYIDQGAEALAKSEQIDQLQKGKPALALGSKKTWGDKEYIKTASGWKPVGKNSGKAKEAHDYVHGHGIEVGKEYGHDLDGKVTVTKVEENTGDKADKISHHVTYKTASGIEQTQGINGFKQSTKDNQQKSFLARTIEEEKKADGLPENIQELVDNRRVSYRGMGWGKEGVKIKVAGKEYVISDEKFKELGGIQKIRFSAPERKHR